MPACDFAKFTGNACGHLAAAGLKMRDGATDEAVAALWRAQDEIRKAERMLRMPDMGEVPS